MATGITKEKLQALRTAMNAALEPVAKAHGLAALTAGHVTFDSLAGSFHFKVEGVTIGGLTPEESRYDSCGFLKLPPRGTTFTHGATVHTITGMNTTGTKIITTVGSTRYTWPIEEVRRHFPDVRKAAGGAS